MPRDAAAGRGGARASILAPITRERRSLLRRHARGAQRRRRGKRGGAQGPPPSAPGPADLGRHGKRRRRPTQARVHREQRRLARPRTSRLRHRVRRAPRLRAAAAQRQPPASPFPRIPGRIRARLGVAGIQAIPRRLRQAPSFRRGVLRPRTFDRGGCVRRRRRHRPERPVVHRERAERAEAPQASEDRRRRQDAATAGKLGRRPARARGFGRRAPTGLCVVSHRVLGASAGGGVHALAQRDDRAAHALGIRGVRGPQSPSTRVGGGEDATVVALLGRRGGSERDLKGRVPHRRRVLTAQGHGGRRRVQVRRILPRGREAQGRVRARARELLAVLAQSRGGHFAGQPGRRRRGRVEFRVEGRR